MSSGSSEAIDLLNLPAGTTVAEFQKRLLETQNATRDRHLEDRLIEDDEDLRKKIALLEQQAEQMENNVSNLEKKIRVRKEKRQKEAGITNLTPEERAQFVIDEEKEGYDDVPNLDVIFEYMLLVGSSATDNTNDLSQADFLGADNKLREEAMSDSKVLQQSEYTYLKFTKAKNILETRQDGSGDIRHCELSGVSFHEEFTIYFDVLEPSMVMSNIQFDIGIQLKMALGPLLQQIKKTANILGFFQLLVHYVRLKDQRNNVFEHLAQKYKGSSISAEILSDSRLKLQGDRLDGICLILEWKMVIENNGRLEANVRDHIKPQLSMEAIAPIEWAENDQKGVLEKVNGSYINLVKLQGVLQATETMVNKILK